VKGETVNDRCGIQVQTEVVGKQAALNLADLGKVEPGIAGCGRQSETVVADRQAGLKLV